MESYIVEKSFFSEWAGPIIKRVITFSQTCLYSNSPLLGYGDDGGDGI